MEITSKWCVNKDPEVHKIIIIFVKTRHRRYIECKNLKFDCDKKVLKKCLTQDNTYYNYGLVLENAKKRFNIKNLNNFMLHTSTKNGSLKSEMRKYIKQLKETEHTLCDKEKRSQQSFISLIIARYASYMVCFDAKSEYRNSWQGLRNKFTYEPKKIQVEHDGEKVEMLGKIHLIRETGLYLHEMVKWANECISELDGRQKATKKAGYVVVEAEPSAEASVTSAEPAFKRLKLEDNDEKESKEQYKPFICGIWDNEDKHARRYRPFKTKMTLAAHILLHNIHPLRTDHCSLKVRVEGHYEPDTKKDNYLILKETDENCGKTIFNNIRKHNTYKHKISEKRLTQKQVRFFKRYMAQQKMSIERKYNTDIEERKKRYGSLFINRLYTQFSPESWSNYIKNTSLKVPYFKEKLLKYDKQMNYEPGKSTFTLGHYRSAYTYHNLVTDSEFKGDYFAYEKAEAEKRRKCEAAGHTYETATKHYL